MPKIEPTEGRIVWYRPGPEEHAHFAAPPPAGKPLSAMIAGVNDDSTINIGALDHHGHPFARQHVHLVQDGETPPTGAYAEWMPYQKGQAAKTEALQVQVAAAAPAPAPAAPQAPAPQPAPPPPPAPAPAPPVAAAPAPAAEAQPAAPAPQAAPQAPAPAPQGAPAAS